MRELIRQITLGSWITAAAALATVLSWRIFFGKDIPPEIPLFYSKPWGAEQLAAPEMIWIPVALIFIASLISVLVAKRLKRYEVLAVTIISSLLCGQIILALAIIRIVVLVM